MAQRHTRPVADDLRLEAVVVNMVDARLEHQPEVLAVRVVLDPAKVQIQL